MEILAKCGHILAWAIDLVTVAAILLLGYIFPIRASWKFVSHHISSNNTDNTLQESLDELLVMWSATILFEALFIPVGQTLIKFLELIEYGYHERNIALFRVMVLCSLYFNLFDFRHHFLAMIKAGIMLVSRLLRRVPCFHHRSLNKIELFPSPVLIRPGVALESQPTELTSCGNSLSAAT